MKASTILILMTLSGILAHDHHGHHGHDHGHVRRLDDDDDDDDYEESSSDDARELRRRGVDYKRCGASEPTEEDLKSFVRAQAFAKVKAVRQVGPPAPTRIIPVCFHIPETKFKNDSRYVSIEDLQVQLDHLNQAYSTNSCCDPSLDWCHGECSSVNVNIKFVVAKIADNQIIGTSDSTSDPDACIKRPQGRQWMRMGANDETSRFIKSNLRVGDQRTLNIYLVRFFDPTLLGFATPPWGYNGDPLMDGVAVNPGSLRGYGDIGGYNEGDTLVHEVGHWLGLFHTFQNGCNGVGTGTFGTIVGDGIDDTPAEAVPNVGCSPGDHRDTCTDGDASPDPIFNFMDYSADSCMYAFTAGQAAAILHNIDMYRTPSTTKKPNPPVQLQDSVPSQSLPFLDEGVVQPYYMSVPTNSTVSCTAVQDQGDVDLFMNWDGSWADYIFDCQSAHNGTWVESCEIGPNFGVAYAFVEAFVSSVNVTVTCHLTTAT